ncbi:Alpha/Beta hydrolase protein [Mycena epipterygia]|nr:Alpha/Beta hydrolase protein [Mycena epipterygia]
MSQYAHLSTSDPEFLDAWSKLPMVVTQPAPIEISTQRHYMTAVAVPQIKETLEPHLPPDSSYSVENRTIPPVPRANESGGFSILVWLHGGGWASGDLDIDDYYLRIISVDFRLSIVNVDYRLAPEHTFPAGLNDSYAALKWTATHAPDISGSLAKGFLVGGVSAGANFAAALTHRARDNPFFAERKLTGHILQVPMVLHPAAYPEELKPELLSIEQNKDAPIITRANIDFFLDCLRVDPSDSEFSSLLLSHENLSPAYIQISGVDPLRDEGILYEKKLRESNVKTRLDVYPGVPHAFHVSFPQLAASQKWEADFRAGLGWLLSGP